MSSEISQSLHEYMSQQCISLPLSPFASQILQKYRPNIKIPDLIPDWSPDIKGLCRLRVMLQDQEEPELSLAFYMDNGDLFSAYYGNFSGSESEFIPDIFIQRYPVKAVPVPGESENFMENQVPRVILYEEMGEHLLVSSILDMIGVVANEEFHAIRFVEHNKPLVAPHCRNEVLRGLELCIGNSLAAEVCLCVLMSKIQQRAHLIGTFSVNFTGLTRESALNICNSLKTLTRTVVLPLSLDYLNSQNFSPQKSQETEKLTPSPLQIPENSLLILNETELGTGQLSSKGIENVNILMQLIQSQQLTYDFGYTKINFPTDLQIIVLSEGKSLLKLPISLPISSPNEYFKFSEAEKAYISVSCRSPTSIPEEITKVAQDFFVSKRKDNKITVDELHFLLTLCRSISQSYLESTVTEQHWAHAVHIFSEFQGLF